MKWILEIILSVAMFFSSLIAIWISIKAITTSNNQNLFNKRVESYTVFLNLYHTYNNNKKTLLCDVKRIKNDGDKGSFNSGMYLTRMTNTPALYDVYRMVKNVNHITVDDEIVFDFSSNVKKLNGIADTFQFLFNTDDQSVNLISGFVHAYADYLCASFEYVSAQTKMTAAQVDVDQHNRVMEENKGWSNSSDLEYARDNSVEMHARSVNTATSKREDLFSKIERLDELYEQISNTPILEEIEDTIRL